MPYLTSVDSLTKLSAQERLQLGVVAKKYAFRLNDYYEKLIDWDDPLDPIRTLVIPKNEEMADWGELDASQELFYTPVRGCQHKYRDTALLLVNEVCGAYCRYCFRKRLFMNGNDEASLDISSGLRYIAEHEEVSNVLLTGGDPLILSTRRLREVFDALSSIPHVRIIRIGSKMVAFDPFRVLDDPDLLDSIRTCVAGGTQVYIMNHFDHPRELTRPARGALGLLLRSGAQVVNQCPIIRGVNASTEVLATLFRELSFAGCPPYYVFQCRPTQGNEPYEVPLVESFLLFNEAGRRASGLAKRARFVMSHRTGKIEVVGIDEDYIYMRYHRAHREEWVGRMLIAERDDEADWLDDLHLLQRSGYPGMAEGMSSPSGEYSVL
ncbi:MAG: KamA family radical SAM protein [Acidobacteriota bacterium]